MHHQVPLLEESSNTSRRKRKQHVKSDDEIMEGAPADWQAAAKAPKKPKTGSHSLTPRYALHDDDPGLEEDDLRGCILQQPSYCASTYGQPPVRPDARPIRMKWFADPSKLPAKKKEKKLKYYGVLVGANPGIYYSWEEAEPQVKGFIGGVYISSTEASEIEAFMNHGPSNCRWAICARQCSQLPPLEKSIAKTFISRTAGHQSNTSMAAANMQRKISTLRAPPAAVPHTDPVHCFGIFQAAA